MEDIVIYYLHVLVFGNILIVLFVSHSRFKVGQEGITSFPWPLGYKYSWFRITSLEN